MTNKKAPASVNKLTEDCQDWSIVSAANIASSTTAGTHCDTGLSLDPHAFSLLAEPARISSMAALRLRAEGKVCMHLVAPPTPEIWIFMVYPPDSLFCRSPIT